MTVDTTKFQDFNVKECLILYTQKRYDKLCQEIFAVLKHCHEVYYSSFSTTDLKYLNAYVEFVLFLLAQEDFQFPGKWVPLFVNVSHLFANLVVISNHKITDGFLKSIIQQDHNYAKILFLYTCRSDISIDFKSLINPNPQLATLWWNNFSVAPPGSTSEHLYTQMQRHLLEFPTNLDLPDIRVQPVYFQCSYFGINDRPIKEWYNDQVRKFANLYKIRSKVRKGSIAIVTDKWIPTTAVYKSSYPQIAKLAEKYDLTLVCSDQINMEQVDRSLFNHVVSVHIGVDQISIQSIVQNDFELAYFPDIGMTNESVFLANLRLAPIMVCGYGHPVSTYGSFINYFIGGIDSELAHLAQENYSERLILIPGLGAHPVDPQYTRRHPIQTDTTYINCCWTTAKINWPMLRMLQNIQKQSSCKIHYQFFPSWTCTRYNSFIILANELNRLFKNQASVYPNLEYHDYLAKLEQGTLTVDSYPFGGYNTIVDSLFAGCPVVTIEGTKFYNRAATALTKRIGADLATDCIVECEQKILSLLENPEELTQVRDKLIDVDRLRQLLIATDEPQYFVKAIDYILANHPIPGKQPIIIT